MGGRVAEELIFGLDHVTSGKIHCMIDHNVVDLPDENFKPY